MFIFHIAETLGLLSLASGVGLYVWGQQTEGKGSGIAKFFGVIVTVLSILSILCTSWYGIQFWTKGSMQMMSMSDKNMCHCMSSDIQSNHEHAMPQGH